MLWQQIQMDVLSQSTESGTEANQGIFQWIGIGCIFCVLTPCTSC